jgi:erythromycin esterase
MLNRTRTESEAQIIRHAATSLFTHEELDPLMERIGDARFVLLGEATHGTSDFYFWRARLTQRLIQEKGFSFVAVEGDWPSCYTVNRYVKNYEGVGATAREVLHDFERWPTWMWANWEVVALVEWLRRYNDNLKYLPTTDPPPKVGFYGLDVYSLWESLEEIIRYLKQYSPEDVDAALRAYSCFQPYGEDVQAYAFATRFVPTSCEDEVLNLLVEMQEHTRADTHDGDPEAAFDAEQNALAAVGAERYYRTMIRGDVESWNVRDQYMVDTLERLVEHHGSSSKAIVWEHNTHIGDARATPMARVGMVNVGQLVRERRSDEGVVLVGFGTYRGSVIAGREWGAPMEVMPVDEARSSSWEGKFHDALAADSLLIFPDGGEESSSASGNDGADADIKKFFQQSYGHRAIGVVYDPDIDRQGGYVPSSLSQRYDAFIYLETTHALHPLHISADAHEPPETFPWGV